MQVGGDNWHSLLWRGGFIAENASYSPAGPTNSSQAEAEESFIHTTTITALQLLFCFCFCVSVPSARLNSAVIGEKNSHRTFTALISWEMVKRTCKGYVEIAAKATIRQFDSIHEEHNNQWLADWLRDYDPRTDRANCQSDACITCCHKYDMSS